MRSLAAVRLDLNDPRLTAHLLPYGGSQASDPFQQLVSLVGVPSETCWLEMARVNEQPDAWPSRAVQEHQRARHWGCPSDASASERTWLQQIAWLTGSTVPYREICPLPHLQRRLCPAGVGSRRCLFPDEPPAPALGWHQRLLAGAGASAGLCMAWPGPAAPHRRPGRPQRLPFRSAAGRRRCLPHLAPSWAGHCHGIGWCGLSPAVPPSPAAAAGRSASWQGTSRASSRTTPQIQWTCRCWMATCRVS